MAANSYKEAGFLTAQPIISADEAPQHVQALSDAEAAVGPLHYMNKVHLFMQSPLALATHPAALDIVEQCIGKNILLYNCTYIIKEPASASFVSWHQDLTYWGLSDDAQVSMWLALTPANGQSGCMRMIPGSHKGGAREHTASDDGDNVLDLGQTVAGINEDSAVLCDLQPGEASFHHGWTLHASAPNVSAERRIGLNVQYIAPHVRQLKQAEDSAMLVRGEDSYGFYTEDKIISHKLTEKNTAALQAYRDKFIETYNKNA